MENICRTCLRSPGKLFSLMDDNGLIYKIETISSLQLSDNDKFPSTICEECISNVNKLFNFRKVIINSDKEIRERYAALQRSDYNKPKIKTNEMQSKDSATVEDDVKSKLQHNPESVDGNDCDSSASMGSDIETESDIGESKESDPMDSVKRALATMKMCKCNICNKVFTSRFKLYNHRRSEHVAPGICNICGLTVRTDNLKRHVQMHSEGPVECKHCGKVFKNTESLRGHLLIHRGLTFTCEICGKMSKVKSEHRRHMKSHEDPELGKVMCTICGKKVRDLRKHMHSHTGERPYLCSYCSKGFTSPYALKVHTRQHTNEKPYVCEYCPMAFPQKVSLTTHIKSKHNVEVTNCSDN